MKERILIFDLKTAFYTYQSTIYPSTLAMMISGYHKAKKDNVVFTAEVVSFRTYTKVYIVKDHPGQLHMPSWLAIPQAILVGAGWQGMETYDPEWEEYPLDISLYDGWLKARSIKYPKYNEDRLSHFKRTPVLLNKKGGWYLDHSGKDILVCDVDLIKKDPQCKRLNFLEAKSVEFLYPLEITAESVNAVCKFIKDSKGNVKREKLWGVIPEIPSVAEQEILIQAWKKYKISRLFQWKLEFTANTDEDWVAAIEPIIEMVYRFKEQAGKRIFLYPYLSEFFEFPEFFKELRRWTGSKATFNHNNLLDYFILDSCDSYKNIALFIFDPNFYMEKKKGGYRRLAHISECLEKYPQLIEIISRPMPGRFSS